LNGNGQRIFAIHPAGMRLAGVRNLTRRILPPVRPNFKIGDMSGRSSLISLVAIVLVQSGGLPAEPIPVRYREGTMHGFLALRTLEGKILAAGDLTQTIRKNNVVSRLVFRFKDGSVDDETTTFSQQRDFRLISDHHVQKGPSFPHPTDLSIATSTGQVTVRYTDKGNEKVETERMDLPADLANGIILDLLKNIRPDAAETKVSFLAATPKPRLVKLSIVPRGEDRFSVVGARYKATVFVVKVELGGLTGVIAPMIGKQPPDTKVWVVASGAPAFVKAEESLYPGGPVWRIEMTSPAWPNAPNSHR
jgi:hypothetical protein